ncbi:MAG: DNA polymerase IV [candidate division WOR-3 bacterium]
MTACSSDQAPDAPSLDHLTAGPLVHPSVPPAPEREVLHVDMDAFFASVEQQVFPFLRGRPVGVCGDPDSRTVVAAASYEAKRRGVKTAMTLPEAKRLCPEIVLVPGCPARYVDTSVRIIAYYATLTDLVEVFSIDEAFLDVTATSHLFGGPEAVARKIKDWLKETFGLTCSIGIAPNKLLAKLVGELNKPDGLTRVRRSEVPALMAKTPVEELCGIGHKTREKLHRLGIRTCAELGRYPERELVRLFGVIGAHLHRMGLGEDDSPVMACYHEPPVKSMGHSFTLDRDTRDIAEIRKHLLQLSEQVGRRLRQDSFAGRTVTLVLRYADFTTLCRQRSLKTFIDDGYRIYSTALRLFEELYQPPRLVRLLGVSVSSLVRRLHQDSLFDTSRNQSLFQTIDRLNNRLGEFSISRGTLIEPAPGPRVISPAWRPQKHARNRQPAGRQPEATPT